MGQRGGLALKIRGESCISTKSPAQSRPTATQVAVNLVATGAVV